MKVNIVKIGNSRGIRIPKPVFEQCGFEDEVDMTVHNHELIISSTEQPRKGWNEAFKAMHRSGDDELLDMKVAETCSEWDEKQWGWNEEI